MLEMTFKKNKYCETFNLIYADRFMPDITYLINYYIFPEHKHNPLNIPLQTMQISWNVFSGEKNQHSSLTFTSADSKELTVNPVAAFLHAFYITSTWTYYEFTL